MHIAHQPCIAYYFAVEFMNAIIIISLHEIENVFSDYGVDYHNDLNVHNMYSSQTRQAHGCVGKRLSTEMRTE